MLIVLCRMPRDAPHQGTKRGRGSVYLVIVSTIWEGAQLVNKGSIPLAFHELNHALLTLRGEWKSLKGRRLRMTSARSVEEHSAGLRVHQMGLCARKARCAYAHARHVTWT